MKVASITGLTAALLALVATGTTSAEPVALGHVSRGYVYFNRPAAELTDLNDDLGGCRASIAEAFNIVDYNPLAADKDKPLPLLLTPLLSPLGPSLNAEAGADLENCMVVRGWRVVRLPDAEGAALAELPPADVTARLSPWIGAQMPQGDIVRIWANDAARNDTRRYESRPAYFEKGQLSLRAHVGHDWPRYESHSRPPGDPPIIDARWQTGALTPATLSKAPAEGGVLLVRINAVTVGFQRVEPGQTGRLADRDHAPDMAWAGYPAWAGKKGGVWKAFAVPAGRWRIINMGVTTFCLGAPSFEIKPGEVVYAGTFDGAAETVGPDLELAAARAWLAGTPAADTARPAAYVNGSVAPCMGVSIYALEVPGASFEAGYHWGGAAPKPTTRP
jgi:hypothetical protein